MLVKHQSFNFAAVETGVTTDFMLDKDLNPPVPWNCRGIAPNVPLSSFGFAGGTDSMVQIKNVLLLP